MNQTKRSGQRGQQLIAGTSSGVPDDVLGAREELRWMEPHVSSPSPCSCKIERVVVENPLSRVGHTQIAAFGAFFKNRWQA